MSRFTKALAIAGVAVSAGAMFVTPSHAGAAAPGCTVLYSDSNSDAPDDSNGVSTGPQQNDLDITQGQFCLSSDGTTLRAILTILNQDFAFSTTGPGIDYQMAFSFGTTSGQPNLYATDASLTRNPSGAPVKQFTFGKFQPIGVSQVGLTTTQYVITAANLNGTFGSGANATVEVDVPLADITTGGSAPPTGGDTLSSTQGFTASGGGNQGVGNEFFSDVDPSLTTFGANYTIPGPSASTPEAPVAPLLLGVGGIVLAAAGLGLKRRR